MATDDELLGALDSALGAGNMKVAEELGLLLKQSRIRNQPLPPPVKLGQEGMPAAIRETAKGEGTAEQILAGIGSAPAIAGHAVAQLAGANNGAALQDWQSVRGATPLTEGGNLGGNAAIFGLAPTRALGPVAGLLGAKAFPRIAQVGDMVATQGGLGAAATPGGWEERMMAGLIGSGGSSIPAVMAAGQGTRRAVTQQGKRLAIAEGLQREIGNADSPALISALEGTPYPTSAFGVQPSAAMLTKNPSLQVMETGSRVRTPDLWSNFDRTNASARWKALEGAAGSEKDLTQLRALRDSLTGDMRDTAMHNATLSANPLKGGSVNVQGADIAPLRAKLAELSGGANRPNKDVQTLVNYVGGELEQGVSPEQLYTIRKMLTDGIKAGPTSELSQAARAARPQRMQIIGEIDKTLNEMSSGGWQKYLDTYKEASPEIGSRQAMLNIRDKLTYGRAAGEVPAAMGERPAPYPFGRLLEQYGSKEFGSKNVDMLTPRHRMLTEALLQDLESQAGVMSAKSTLGSPTAPFLASAGRVNQIANGLIDAAGSAVPIVGGTVAASAKNSLGRLSEETLATLLKDPQALAEALRRAADSQMLLNRAGRVGQAAGAGARSMRE